MALEDELAKLLNAHAKNNLPKFIVIGEATNIGSDTCDVEVNGEAKLLGVRLHCVEGDLESKFVVKPKDKSLVAVGILENLKGEWILLQCSEIEEVLIKIGTVEYSINSTGVLIKKGDDTLKKCLDDMFNQIALLTVPVVAVGSPSGTPANVTAFNNIKTRIDNLLR